MVKFLLVWKIEKNNKATPIDEESRNDASDDISINNELTEIKNYIRGLLAEKDNTIFHLSRRLWILEKKLF